MNRTPRSSPTLLPSLAAALLAAASLAAQDTRPAGADQIDALLARTFRADAPGASVIAVRGGEVVLRKGYGMANLELAVPMQPEHVLRLGSITKQFTAIAILQLAEAGKLGLDDDVKKYVPELRTGGHAITLTHLLTHTSGLPSFTDQPAWQSAAREDMTLEKELSYIEGERHHFAPGTDWEYCNTGYRLLGAVVEKVSGLGYADYVRKRIFEPAGMTSSAYDDTDRVMQKRVPGYTAGPDREPANAAFVSMTQPHGAGALVSSVDDLWRWSQALAAGKLVAPASLAKAFTSARLSDGRATGYGFGWTIGTIAGRTSQEHGGGIQGFSTYALSVPDSGIYVAVLCNTDRPRTPPGAVASQVATLLLGGPAPLTPASVPAETLRRYAGVYRDGQQKLALVVDGERLVLELQNGRKVPLTAVSATELLAPGIETRYQFAGEGKGPAARVLIRPRAAPERWAQRVDEPLRDPEAPPFAVRGEVLDGYVGSYELAKHFVLTVKRDGDGLTAQATGQSVTHLVAESATRFRVREVPAKIEFKTDDAGKVTGIVLLQNGRESPGKRL